MQAHATGSGALRAVALEATESEKKLADLAMRWINDRNQGWDFLEWLRRQA